MKKLKRLLGLALCLCAAACALCVGASAEEGHTAHFSCGAKDCQNTMHEHTEVTEWTAWNGTDNITYDANNTAYVYLAADATRDSILKVESGYTLYLCLNGKTITAQNPDRNSYVDQVILVSGNLILSDCGSDGTLTHDSGTTQDNDTRGSGVSVPTGGNFIMYGGTISGNRMKVNGGSGVFVNGGTFKMYGGAISGNTIEDQAYGGGVYVTRKGTFEMRGGAISSNTAANGRDGGGVYVASGSFIMHNGIISENTAGGEGGGVYVGSGGEFEMHDGTISDNMATGSGNQNGGGVYVKGSQGFTMHDGTISGNTANNNGGGVCVSNGKFEMEKGTISGNAATNGGGVYFVGTSSSCVLTVSGSPEITGNNASGSGGGVYFWDYQNAAFKVSGGISITGNKYNCTADANGDLTGGTDNNVYLTSGSYITVTDTLTNTISVRTADEPNSSNYVTIAKGNESYTKPEKFQYENDETGISVVGSGSDTMLVVCQHSWGTDWNTDDSNHWHECSICNGKDNEVAHNYNQDVVNDGYKKSDANCKSSAVYYKSCECGKMGTETFTSGDKDPSNHAGTLGGWQSDENNHWKEYSCCHVRAEEDGHDWNSGEVTKAADCENKGTRTYTCSKCQKKKEEAIGASGHSWRTEWTSDGEYHWHECQNEGCPVTENSGKDGYSQHTGGEATCIAKAKCETCGAEYGTPLGHDWKKNEWSHDATHHWRECQNEGCSEKNNYNQHGGGTATCTEKAVCTTCGTAYGSLDPSNHSKTTTTWTKTSTTHKETYSCCNAVKTAEAAHTFSGWNNSKRSCDVCGYEETCTNHTGGTATCIAKAKCETCGAEYGDFAEHVWGAWTSTGNDTHTRSCTTTGCTQTESGSCSGGTATCTEKAKCETCGAEYGDPLGHDPVHHDAKAATCTEKGWDAYDTCSRCDYTTYAEISATGHTPGTPVIENKVDAACTTVGSCDEVVYCTKCTTELTRTSKTIPALNHDFTGGAWQHDESQHWKQCSRCDEINTKTSHTFSQSGRTYTCTDCDYSYTVSSGGGSTITVPVTGSRDTVQISASVSGGTATVKEIRQDELDKIGTDSDVVIDLAGLGKSVTGVTLPGGTIDSVSDSAADGMTVKLPGAQLRLDRQTLAALAEQTSGRDVRLVVETDSKAKSTMNSAQKQALEGMKNAAAIEAYFVSNGQRISDFDGGAVELTVPYRTDGAIRAWYLKEDGTREQVSAVYDRENARLTLRHFSHYVIEELEADMGYASCPKDSSCPIAPYTDAAPAAWYHDGVHYCIDNGLMQGVSTSRFLPDGSTTRAQLVTILWRLEGAPAAGGSESFRDVADGAWYTAAVRWAAGEGIVQGYGDGRFGPDDAVTREQMVAILWRFAQYKGADVSTGGDTNILSYTDAVAVSEYAIPAMQWACGCGLVAGVAQEGGLTLVPKGTTTRAQAATLMMRLGETLDR